MGVLPDWGGENGQPSWSIRSLGTEQDRGKRRLWGDQKLACAVWQWMVGVAGASHQPLTVTKTKERARAMERQAILDAHHSPLHPG